MNDPLVLLSGLPGTGKTRLAIELSKTLHLPVLSKDRFQARLRAQGLAGREGVAGYEFLFDIADQQLCMGIGVILDAVFPKGGFRLRAEQLAQDHNATFKPIFCFCSDDDLLKGRMRNRDRYVPDWTPVGWEEMLEIKSYFEPWPAGSVLELDAAQDFAVNLARALDWIWSP
jgi:predicted kinase